MDDKPLTSDEQRIYDSIANPVRGRSRQALRRNLAIDGARRKFVKVYRAPGYPVDPRRARARALDAYVNAFAPQPAGTLDRRPLDAWLGQNVN